MVFCFGDVELAPTSEEVLESLRIYHGSQKENTDLTMIFNSTKIESRISQEGLVARKYGLDGAGLRAQTYRFESFMSVREDQQVRSMGRVSKWTTSMTRCCTPSEIIREWKRIRRFGTSDMAQNRFKNWVGFPSKMERGSATMSGEIENQFA
ncbi:hypothetical protein HAX54_008196 [Datura stramonium]|uniref:Uncharacterized protein n=1 Tax=Datura stramonium TaxID=4076 RepID=A0ABS8TD03_DATST|nr:hypothetical protein [Datura stramonium]